MSSDEDKLNAAVLRKCGRHLVFARCELLPLVGDYRVQNLSLLPLIAL